MAFLLYVTCLLQSMWDHKYTFIATPFEENKMAQNRF